MTSLFYGKFDWHDGFRIITEQTNQKHVLFKWPKVTNPAETEDLCMQRLGPTSESISTPAPIIVLQDCQDEKCDSKCSCLELRSDNELFACDSACKCVTGLNVKTGMLGDGFPHPSKYELQNFPNLALIGEPEFTIYGWSRDEAENFPGYLIWSGLRCWGFEQSFQSFYLYRQNEIQWWLVLWRGNDFVELEVERIVDDHKWFFWAIRRKLVGAGLYEYTLRINEIDQRVEYGILNENRFNLLGVSGLIETIPASLERYSRFAGCYSGLTVVTQALSDSYLSQVYGAGCEQ